MENIEIAKQEQIDLFVKRYNKWLEKIPIQYEIKFVHFSHLVIIKDIDEKGHIDAANVTCSHLSDVSMDDILTCHEYIKEQIDVKSKECLEQSPDYTSL
jgi:hypothetical protein